MGDASRKLLQARVPSGQHGGGQFAAGEGGTGTDKPAAPNPRPASETKFIDMGKRMVDQQLSGHVANAHEKIDRSHEEHVNGLRDARREALSTLEQKGRAEHEVYRSGESARSFINSYFKDGSKELGRMQRQAHKGVDKWANRARGAGKAAIKELHEEEDEHYTAHERLGTLREKVSEHVNQHKIDIAQTANEHHSNAAAAVRRYSSWMKEAVSEALS